MRYSLERVEAVVLAGGINSIELFDGYRPGYKALLPFCGKPSIQYVVKALEQVPNVAHISIVGPVDELSRTLPQSDHLDFISPGESMIDNILIGLRHFRKSPIVLFLTGDLPLVTPEAIRDFLKIASRIETPYEQNIFLSVVPKWSFHGAYQKRIKGFNRFKDIAVCHGNLLLVDPRCLAHSKMAVYFKKLYEARKSTVRATLSISCSIGLVYLFGVHLFHLLRMDQMARMGSRHFNLGLIPAVLEHPEIALDVDEPEDYALVKELLEKNSEGH
jgi:GTP:adenosylcobinamide-phosphate guanylyltransferase